MSVHSEAADRERAPMLDDDGGTVLAIRYGGGRFGSTNALVAIVAATIVFLSGSAASARHHTTYYRGHAGHALIVCDQRGCSDRATRGPRYQLSIGRRARIVAAAFDADGNTVVGGRPAGCPYEFCGCEASRYVFGEIRRELNLASNWIRKFSRARPAAGMAAVRNHHVMILISHVGGLDWLVHDGNSGAHLTREHVRSIANYLIVDPHATRTARAVD